MTVSDPRNPKGPPSAGNVRITEPPPEFAGAVVSSVAIPVAKRAPPPPPPAPPAPPEEEILGSEDLEEIEEFEVLDAEPVPSKAPPPPADAIPAASSTHKDPAAKVVMVVEDDASIRTMIVRALGLSYTVYEAEDGMTAMEMLAKLPPPACIVSDWMMPRLDGVELAKRVRGDKNLKLTPFIMLTAKNNPMDVVQGINAGARHYLAKPFKMKELLDKVAGVLGSKK